MKKTWIKRIAAVIVFLIALVVIDRIMNSESSEITMDMPQADLPVVSAEVGGYEVNTMYGYTDAMPEALMKSEITPIGEDRTISLLINPFRTQVETIEYEVRSVDGERLIESGTINSVHNIGNEIGFSLQLKDLIDVETEYSFVTILTLETGEKAYYYTRFIEVGEYYEREKLDYIMDFHEVTLSGGDGQEIKKYLESSSKADNSSLAQVNINSSLAQVMWDELSVQQVDEPIIRIKDISEQSASVVLQYLVQEEGSKNEDYYFVEEYFRIRYTPDRTYLLDYERTAEEIFDAKGDSFESDRIRLGITSADLTMEESEGGKYVAFVNGSRLFIYNTIDNKLSQVFSFYDSANFDVRTLNRNFDIHILDMEDSGNMTFMVGGYMNRGLHEGSVGIAVYYYNSLLNVIEEQIFIPYDKSADILMQEMNNISYLNKDNHLFLILEGTLYDIGLDARTSEVVVTGLTEDIYKVSDSQRMIIWMKENDPYATQTLVWMNLNSGSQLEIKAGSGEYVTALGFMEEDLIYGLVKKEDILTDATGNTLFPVYQVVIENQEGEVMKTYRKEGYYITGCTIEDNQINLTRVRKSEEGGYSQVQDDQIASSGTKTDTINQINTVAVDVYKTIVQIVLKNTVDSRSLKVLTPKEVIFEGGRQLTLETEANQQRYYVYGPYGVERICSSSAEAITLAYGLSGTVADEEGNTIWKKGTKYTRNQIMAITGEASSAEKSSLAVCLDNILSLEGISRDTQPLLEKGEDALTILTNNLRQARILELTGCSLDTVLYYVDQDIPVLALLQNDEAVLVIGFNEQNVVLMDPATGTVYKKGMNDSRTMFENNGNRFISYIRTDD